MKKSELRQMIREEIGKLTETTYSVVAVKNGKVLSQITPVTDKQGIKDAKDELKGDYPDAKIEVRTIQESKLTEEASVEAIAISKYTATRPEAVDKFIADNKLNAKKLLALAVHGNLSDRMDIVTAMVGNPGNSIQKKLIAQFKEANTDDFSHLKGQSDKELSKLLDTIHKQQEINGKQYVTAKKAGQPTKEIEAAGDRLAKREKAVIDSRAKKLPSKAVSSDAKIKNPETGRTIKVSTALNYDKNSPAYKLAAKKAK